MYTRPRQFVPVACPNGRLKMGQVEIYIQPFRTISPRCDTVIMYAMRTTQTRHQAAINSFGTMANPRCHITVMDEHRPGRHVTAACCGAELLKSLFRLPCCSFFLVLWTVFFLNLGGLRESTIRVVKRTFFKRLFEIY